MTIDEAIKLLRLDLKNPGSTDYNDRAKARKLGIEALEFFKEFQKITGNHQDARLPGETKK